MAVIPGPKDSDSDDVALALEVAQAQWARGDHVEALKWLRKAADSAFGANDDRRGIELSKLAADLPAREKHGTKPKLPAPREPSPPAIPAPRPPQPPPAAARVMRPEAAPIKVTPAAAPRRPVPGKPLRRSAPDFGEEESTREYKAVDLSKVHAAESAKTRSEVRPPAGSPIDEEWPTEAVDDLAEVAVEDRAAAVPRPAEAAKETPKKKLGEQRPAMDQAFHAASVPVPFTQALRVAVKRSDDGRVVVRVLDGNGLRDGERDAMLVALTDEGWTRFFK